ncbi:hypothetical protein GGR56DRAFT_518394 [Xylariaceae sp. FL0804]|nr:hypothetical protein GGR56DRAFT_518394 [Xylariaceae sp. FL0804]
MAPYDSDSSADEEQDYTETNVLLGYASKDPGDDPTSRLGGRAEWLDDSHPPSAALARCRVCGDVMALLLQLNGELPDRFPGHERRLHVFACRRRTCRRREGSVRALRSVRVAPGSKVAKSKKKEEEKRREKEGEEARAKTTASSSKNLGETLFGAKTLGGGSGASGGANPFSTSSPSSSGPAAASSSNPFATGNPFSGAAPSTTESSKPKPPTSPESNPEPETEPEPEPESTTVAEEIKSLPKTFAETLSLNAPPSPAPPAPEPWPPASQQPRPYPVSYLSEAEYETLDPTPSPAPANAAATGSMDVDGSGGGGGGKEDKVVFESTMDAAFQRFADRLAQNPEQSIRYEFGGAPLLYSRSDAVGQLFFSPTSTSSSVSVASSSLDARLLLSAAAAGGGGGGRGMPRCTRCGGARAFEVQLCPHAIAELEAVGDGNDDDDVGVDAAAADDGMDWGTILVGVCERDCQAPGVADGQVGYLEEWAGVQWEEQLVAGAAPPGGGGRR